MAKLAAWARKHNAINVSGFNPALPPGMTERVDPNSNGQMNRHDTVDSGGTSMGSMVEPFPEPHDDDCVGGTKVEPAAR